MNKLKKCSRCKKKKPRTEFYKNKAKGDGLKAYCKKCSKILDKDYRERNPEKIKQIRKTSNERHLTPTKKFNYRLRSVYNLSRAEFDNLYDKQKGKCKLCRKKIKVSKSVHIDHNHKNGKIRGLLCSKCNLGLGHFQDNAEVLLRASKYILNNGDIQ